MESTWAPSIWPIEITNAALVGVKRNRISNGDVLGFIQLVASLPIEVDPMDLSRQPAEIFEIASTYGLSAYDASYLELAIRRSLPLATLDRKLRFASIAAGVALTPG